MNETHPILRIEARMIGKRTPLGAPWQITLPPELLHAATRDIQLRDLISAIVRLEVQAFEQRQQERRVLKVLSAQQINDAALTGKIAMGGDENPPPSKVDEDEAVRVALQGFTDGIYLVFLDGQLQRTLDGLITLQPESSLLFIRLVALVGG